MARPYINTLNATYSNPTFSMNLQYFHVRGGGTFSIAGLSAGIYSPFAAGTTSYYNAGTTYSFRVGTLATASIGGVLIAGSSPSRYIYTATISYPFQNGVEGFTFSA